MALDNIIRRELRVSDPNDPNQIAQALLTRYKDTPRAQAISQEARGLPFLQSVEPPSMVPQAATSSDVELQQAKDDVDRDLHELTTNSLLKDVTPELQGWSQAVRSAMQEGTTAARFALDPRQRDKAFAIRRQLGDYARMARLVGALTPTLNLTYRKFAQSLDEVAGVILVSMGESLANVGFNGGRFLLQAPYSELQTRRDAAIYALRNLIGATQQAYGPNDWPRGLDAYRILFKALEDQGQGDLRALLLEAELTRTMDELIQRAAHGRVEGLRALGSTAQLDLERFRRLVAIGDRLVNIESPPLTTFLEGLQLFADAFEGSGGFRLLHVARPPILLYGLYGTSGFGPAEERLLDLVVKRGVLADRLDCFLQCECGLEQVKCQIILDKILYDVDRAIDLYAVGKDDFGQPERRAAAYGFVIEFFLANVSAILVGPDAKTFKCDISSVAIILAGIQKDLFGPRLNLGLGASSEVRTWVDTLTTYGNAVNTKLTGSADPLAADIRVSLADALQAQVFLHVIGPNPHNDLEFPLLDLALVSSLAQKGEALVESGGVNVVTAAADVEVFNEAFDINGLVTILQQELCVQKDAESRWKNLVKTMAPDCLGIDKVFIDIEGVINGALDNVGGPVCPAFGPTIPPHFETSLEALVKTPR